MKRTPSGLIIDQEGREFAPEQPFRGFNRSAGAGNAYEFHAFGLNDAAMTREQRLARIEALAKLLDTAFVVPGTNVRYGLDGLIGLVPILGDIVTTAISLWIVREARALGAPWYLTARMLSNVAVDGVVGIVPVAGDAFDVMFKANMRNIRMLRRWIDKQQRKG